MMHSIALATEGSSRIKNQKLVNLANVSNSGSLSFEEKHKIWLLSTKIQNQKINEKKKCEIALNGKCPQLPNDKKPVQLGHYCSNVARKDKKKKPTRRLNKGFVPNDLAPE